MNTANFIAIAKEFCKELKRYNSRANYYIVNRVPASLEGRYNYVLMHKKSYLRLSWFDAIKTNNIFFNRFDIVQDASGEMYFLASMQAIIERVDEHFLYQQVADNFYEKQ